MRRTMLVCLAGVAACDGIPTMKFDAAVPVDASPDAPDALVPPPPPPVLWLKMDDDPTDGASDSATGHAVTCSGACPTLTDGHSGGAYHFAANELRIASAGAGDLQPMTELTISMWVRLPAPVLDQDMQLLCKEGTSAAPPSYCISYTGPHNGSRLVFSTSDGGDVGPSLANDLWIHVAMTRSATALNGYVAGHPAINVPASGSLFYTSGPINIGHAGDISPLFGDLDDVRIYDVALSAAQIAELAH
jgi:hypothetical protein